MRTLPISLIIDDSGPVNMAHFHNPEFDHPMLVPPAFALQFGKLCSRYGVKGKFSVVPMPAGLGRLDETENVSQVPAANIREFIRIVREQIQPRFSITPEVLTHYRAYDLKTGYCLHVFEDVCFSSLSAEEIADYVGLALTILSNTGLDPQGMTSPWRCGIDNEDNYAAGIGMAFRKVMNRDRCFYFLHSGDDFKKPILMCDSEKTGRVVSIPNNTFDAFWPTQNPADARTAAEEARKNIDKLLAPDGRTGMVRDLYEQGLPIILISHWQRLYSDGRLTGLNGLDFLVQRINRIFGRQVEWMTFQEIAAESMKGKPEY